MAKTDKFGSPPKRSRVIRFRDLTPVAVSASIVVRAAIVAVAAIAVTPSLATAEKWTGLRGDRSVEADLLGIWEGNAILKFANGRRVSVPLINLISDSRIRANKVAATIETHRAELVSELKAQAAEAAAPAPSTLPEPPAAPDYRPLASKAGAIETLQHIDDQSQSGHVLLAYFDSLPPKYRADLDGVVKAGADTLDVAKIDATLGPLYRLADLIVTRQNWIFSHPRIQMLDEQTQQTLQTLILSAAGSLRNALDPTAFTAETLGGMPLRDWIVQRDSAIAPHLYALTNALPTGGATYEEYVEGQQHGNSGYGMEPEFGPVEPEGPVGPADPLGPAGDPMAGPADAPGPAMGPAAGPAVSPAATLDAGKKEAPESDTMKVKVTQNGQSIILEMLRVDDFWIPKSMADHWDQTIASSKEKVTTSGLTSLIDHPVLVTLGTMLQPMTTSLESASNAEEFHQSMESIFQQTQMLASTLASLAGNASGFSNPWQPASSSSTNPQNRNGRRSREPGMPAMDSPAMEPAMPAMEGSAGAP